MVKHQSAVSQAVSVISQVKSLFKAAEQMQQKVNNKQIK